MALLSDGPHPEHAEAAMLFGQFVGSWDVDVAWYEAGRVVRRARGEWHFAWVLEGRAVQDVWIVPPRSERSAGDADLYEYGTTLRFYDPGIDAWRSTWHGPMHGVVIPFIARKVGDEIVLQGRHAVDGRPMRWVFSDIGADRFLWRSEASADEGGTWDLLQDFVVRRRASNAIDCSTVEAIE